MTRAQISATDPRALGICDRCGFRYNLEQLVWQHDWRGPRVQNLFKLVCRPCLDDMQQNGQRTIILPPDPVPVLNARPEMYVPDDNPMSAVGASPNIELWRFGTQIGTMVNFGGVPAAFDSVFNKPQHRCAAMATANSSYNNYVGINWTGNTFRITAPSSQSYPVRKHSITEFSIYAPNDSTIGSTAFVVQGADVNAGWGSWTTLYSGEPTGEVGETITGTPTGGLYQFHRVAFLGGSGQTIAVAQVTFNVGEVSSGS